MISLRQSRSKAWMAGTSPAMTSFQDVRFNFQTAVRLPATAFRPDSSKSLSPQRTEGAGNAGCLSAPAASCAKEKAHELVTTGSPKHAGIPARLVLTAYSELSPVIGPFCHRPRNNAKHCCELMPASRHQDHTALPSALARSSHAPKRPSHPAPNVRDDREAPLLAGTGCTKRCQ